MRTNKRNLIISTIFFVIYIIISMCITYKTGAQSTMNFFFGADTNRVFLDIINANVIHSRIEIHPLFMFLVVPISSFFTLLFKTPIFGVVILQSLIGAISVYLIGLILKKLEVNKYINILLMFIYGFSFTQFIFTATPETFIYASIFLILFWLYIVYLIKENKDLNRYHFILLSIFGVLTFGVTITNYMQFLVGLGILLWSKKDNRVWERIKIFILVNLLSMSIILGLGIMQSALYEKTPMFTNTIQKVLTKSENFDEVKFIDTSISLDKTIQVSKFFVLNNFISSEIEYDGEQMVFAEHSNITKVIVICFAIVFLISIIYSISKTRGKNYILNGLLIALGLNLVLHLIYGSEEVFLYTQHYTFLVVLIIGVITTYIKKVRVRKAVTISLLLFLIIEIIKNAIGINKIIEIISKEYGILDINIFVIAMVTLVAIIILFLILYIIIKVIKNFRLNESVKQIVYVLIIVSIFFVMQPVFTKLDNVYNSGFIIQREKNAENYLNYLKEEKNYKKEYLEFVQEYSLENYNVNYEEFYMFGMGNREKYIYKGGKVIEVKTSNVVYSFDVKKQVILPHKYMVVIYTVDNKEIKIYENNKGVIIETDKKEIMKGTDLFIGLYSFHGQKYNNIKKVLYNEILINIVNSKPLPNFMAYNNVWYRDAAYVGMVLKNTNNIELIEDWILNIENIYDSENGVQEPDNLGELLYLISLVSNKDNKLVPLVLEEVNRITKVDENGKYIIGITDGAERPVYQTEFLKLGLKKLGIEDDYNVHGIEDNYESLVWWNERNTNKRIAMKDYIKYPYLGWGSLHSNLKQGACIGNLYPLTWEQNAKYADYSKLEVLGKEYVERKVSPIHSWHAAEVLLLLLDEEDILVI